MTKTYLALGFFIIYKLLAGDAYGNTKLKRPFGQKKQTSHNIGAYKTSIGHLSQLQITPGC